MDIPKLLTEKEVAAILRISRTRVKQHLPRIRISSHGVRYDPRDVEALIAKAKEQRQDF